MRATIGHSLEGARWRHEIYSRCEAVLSEVEETNVELIFGLHDNPKMLRIPKWRLALLLTLRGKDRLELFFEGCGHGEAFDDHVVQGASGDRV